jgi:uncharacterized membrane protein YdjX (TVP38/TMEM64 family)/pimeloyl-ACP methyl ester carboxylesterase
MLCLWSIGYLFWVTICDNSLNQCFAEDNFWTRSGFLILSVVRPFFFSPLMQAAYIGGASFGPFWGSVLTVLGAALSAMAVYYPGHIIGKKFVRPWLSANLPSTWQLLRTQDYKVIFVTRFIPLFPFDVMSLLYGMADFHAKRVFVFTLIGAIPEVFFFASFGEPASDEAMMRGLRNIAVFGFMTLIPLLVYEFISRNKGSSLWTRLKRVYYELLYEARVNNEIVKRHQYSSDKIPIILLYGFGSSRKTLNVMENLLTKRGFEVMSFNLGGSLGVFFTRGIKETADFIDRKIQRQMKRYGFKKVHIVAHSKGGLVALWWLLRMGGSEYCDRLITLGTPFKGTWLTYLAMFTPFGWFFKDVWQMAPGSNFLVELHKSPPVPGLKVFCFYSNKDSVSPGTKAVFEHPSDVTGIPMHHVAHFQFLARRDVTQAIVRILRQDTANGRGRRGSDHGPRSQPGSAIQELDDEQDPETGEEEFDSQSGVV